MTRTEVAEIIDNKASAQEFIWSWRTDCDSPSRRAWMFEYALIGQRACLSYCVEYHLPSAADGYREAICVLEQASAEERALEKTQVTP